MKLPGRYRNIKELVKKKKAIEQEISGWPNNKEDGHYCVQLLIDGPLVKCDTRHHRLSDRHAYLFNGMLLLAKPCLGELDKNSQSKEKASQNKDKTSQSKEKTSQSKEKASQNKEKATQSKEKTYRHLDMYFKVKERFVVRNLDVEIGIPPTAAAAAAAASTPTSSNIKKGDDGFDCSFDNRSMCGSISFPNDPNHTITASMSGIPPPSPGYDCHSLTSGTFFGGGGIGVGGNSLNSDTISISTINSETSLLSNNTVSSTLQAMFSLSSNASASFGRLDQFQDNAFTITPRNGPPMTLLAKTTEERNKWLAHLYLLTNWSMLERNLEWRRLEDQKHHPLCLPDPAQYPYAVEDSEANIVFEETKADVSSPVPLIKGATLLKLIERLTYHKYGDPGQVRTFLTTYRSICSPTMLLTLLIKRFLIPNPDFHRFMQTKRYLTSDELSPTNIHPPPTPSSDGSQKSIGSESTSTPASPAHSGASIGSASTEFTFDVLDDEAQKESHREMLKRFQKEYKQPVQFRVLNVLRQWIDHHYYDFQRDEQLLKRLHDFLHENGPQAVRNMRKLFDHIFKVLERRRNQPQLDPLGVPLGTKPQVEWHITQDEKEFSLFTVSCLALLFGVSYSTNIFVAFPTAASDRGGSPTDTDRVRALSSGDTIGVGGHERWCWSVDQEGQVQDIAQLDEAHSTYG